MSGNQWVVRLEKSDDGKVRLKIWGHFYIPAKHIVSVITATVVAVAALGTIVSL